MNSTKLPRVSNRARCVNKGRVVKNADGPRNFSLLTNQPLEKQLAREGFTLFIVRSFRFVTHNQRDYRRHTYIHTYTHTLKHTRIHTHTHTHTQSMRSC